MEKIMGNPKIDTAQLRKFAKDDFSYFEYRVPPPIGPSEKSKFKSWIRRQMNGGGRSGFSIKATDKGKGEQINETSLDWIFDCQFSLEKTKTAKLY